MKFFMIFLIFCTPILLGMCLDKIAEASIGPCQCAVFESQEVQMTTKPILKQNPMNVTCDKNGKETCLKMCTALAQAAKAKGPALLCAVLMHVEALTAYVFAKSCNSTSWIFTKMSNTEPICCHDGEPVTCNIKQ